MDLDVENLIDIIKKKGITSLLVTTALFNILADADIKELKGIKKIYFGGEKVSCEHVKKTLDKIGKNKIVHLYGPTEATVCATYYEVNDVNESAYTIPIGKAVSNTRLYVMDRKSNILPIGAIGELCIAGDGLANGYMMKLEEN